MRQVECVVSVRFVPMGGEREQAAWRRSAELLMRLAGEQASAAENEQAVTDEAATADG